MEAWVRVRGRVDATHRAEVEVEPDPNPNPNPNPNQATHRAEVEVVGERRAHVGVRDVALDLVRVRVGVRVRVEG